jgi:prevent-host-death family protein
MVVTLKELKIQPGRIVSLAESGTEVVVTVRGIPAVKIIPLKKTTGAKSDFDTSAFGIWANRDDMADVEGYVRNIRKGRAL